MIDGFLLGVIATSSATVGLFFLKFWRDTRDPLFLAFGAAFVIEAINRSTMLMFRQPSESSPWIYVVRLLAFLMILAGIVNKNRRARP